MLTVSKNYNRNDTRAVRARCTRRTHLYEQELSEDVAEEILVYLQAAD